jgi:hypothetical protein
MPNPAEQATPPSAANESPLPLPLEMPLAIWKMTASDRERGGPLTAVAIGATTTGLAAEWSGPNEWALGSVGSHVFQLTHNVYETGAAMGGASFAIQAAVGLTAAWALNRCPDAVDKVRELQQRLHDKKRLKKEASSLSSVQEVGSAIDSPVLAESSTALTLEAPEGEKKSQLAQAAAKLGRTAMQKAATVGTELGKAAKWTGRNIGAPLLAGSAITLIMEAPKGERKPYSHNAAKVLGWSAVVGAGVVMLGAGASQLLAEGEALGFGPQARFMVSDILPNPLTYLAIFGGIYAATKGFAAAKRKLPAVFQAARTKLSGPGRYVKGQETEVLSQGSEDPNN